MDPSVAIFGPIDTYLGPYIVYVVLVLLLANMATRAMEYNRIVSQARDGGADAVARYPLRVATSVLLVVTSFYYMTVELHAGLIVSLLVVTLVIADLFEFEARLVEARQEWEIERPKASIGASVLALIYVTYQAFFFLVAPYWELIV